MTAFRSTLAAAAFSAALSAGAGPVWVPGETLAPGVVTMTAKTDTPRSLRFFAVKVDMKIADAGFVATGRAVGWGQPLQDSPTIYDVHGEKIEPADIRTRRETPAEFLQRGGKGALFAFPTRATRRPYSGDFADPRGLFVSDGVVVRNAKVGRGPVFAVRRSGELEIADRIMPAEVPDLLFAQTGDLVIRRDGRDVVPPDLVFQHVKKQEQVLAPDLLLPLFPIRRDLLGFRDRLQSFPKEMVLIGQGRIIAVHHRIAHEGIVIEGGVRKHDACGI